MEEEIKILENYLEDLDIMMAYDKKGKDINIKQAIENLISGYKELEEINIHQSKSLLKYQNSIPKSKVVEIQKENKKIVLENYIPKSKVKEKIEEISGMNEIGDIEREIYNRNEYAIEILLELLED